MTTQLSRTSSFRRVAAPLFAVFAFGTIALASAGPAGAKGPLDYGWGSAGVAAGPLMVGAIAEASRQPASTDDQAYDCYPVRRKVWTGSAWRIERRTACD